MQRIYRVGSLVGFGMLLVLVSGVFAAPAFAAIPRTEVVKRLCDRQDALGSRLKTELIALNLCGVAPATATLTLVKVLPNNSGGTAVATDFQAKIDGANVPWGVAQTLGVGAHTASEVTRAGYTASVWSGGCAANGTITLAAGENKTCTITNDDQPGMLHVVKVVTNDNGGLKVFSDFSFQVNGAAVIPFEADGQNDMTVNAGIYSVTEPAVAGYTTTYDNCTSVVIPNGGSATCTITNNDVAPEPVAPKLTVTKVVVNNDGGTKVVADFPLFVDGVGVTSGVQNTSTIGAHTVSETTDAGYTAVIGGDCAANGTITLVAGDVKACTITNNDKEAVLEGKLLITEVLYDVAAPAQGVETTNEWVEIHNGTDASIDLTGYTLADNTSSDPIPAGTILPAGGFLIVTPGADTAALWSVPAEAMVVVLAGPIGNGLAGNDNVRLLNPSAVVIDGVSWGTNIDPLNPGAAGVAEGNSLARTPITADTNTAADWAEDATPTPGA